MPEHLRIQLDSRTIEEEKHSLQSLQQKFNAQIWEKAGKPGMTHNVTLKNGVFEVLDITKNGESVNLNGKFLCTVPTLMRIVRGMGGKLLS